MQKGALRSIRVLGLLLGLVLLAACTGRGGGGGGGGGIVIVAKRGAFEFVPANVTAPLNVATTITLQNPDSQIHDWTIDSIPVGGTPQRIHLVADPGRTVRQTFTFTQAGTYRVYCSQPGHTEAGMVGQLTVQ
ncbi:MAG: cupredoxin domain-containing protein [Chloroflexota bacterium]|nr:cupredoxin domain-containing protein [Dehalococcoidia bacterium]MDW8253800.1 cupredoxin domain-containing protein [Chloroflexota bacterium]